MLRETIDESFTVPLGRDKCMIDKDKCIGLIDEILISMPGEFRQARHVVEKRNEMLDSSKKEAENIIRAAQEQAKRLISEQEVLRAARQQAAETEAQTKAKMRDLRITTNKYVENLLERTEEALKTSTNEISQARRDFRNTSQKTQ